MIIFVFLVKHFGATVFHQFSFVCPPLPKTCVHCWEHPNSSAFRFHKLHLSYFVQLTKVSTCLVVFPIKNAQQHLFPVDMALLTEQLHCFWNAFYFTREKKINMQKPRQQVTDSNWPIYYGVSVCEQNLEGKKTKHDSGYWLILHKQQLVPSGNLHDFKGDKHAIIRWFNKLHLNMLLKQISTNRFLKGIFIYLYIDFKYR